MCSISGPGSRNLVLYGGDSDLRFEPTSRYEVSSYFIAQGSCGISFNVRGKEGVRRAGKALCPGQFRKTHLASIKGLD